MKIGNLIIRALLNLVTALFPLKDGETSIPRRYLSFDGVISNEKIRRDLTECYRLLFSQAPWFEEWKEEEVMKKFDEETSHPLSFSVIMKGDAEFPIAGFSWGSIIDLEEIAKRISYALSINYNESLEKITEYLRKRKVDKILFFDELGILRGFRGGTDPLRFLTLKGFEKARKVGVKKAIFWSSKKSKIVPVMKMMGFEEIAKIKAKNREIIFLFSPNFSPVLKIAQSVPHNQVTKIMKIASSLS